MVDCPNSNPYVVFSNCFKCDLLEMYATDQRTQDIADFFLVSGFKKVCAVSAAHARAAISRSPSVWFLQTLIRCVIICYRNVALLNPTTALSITVPDVSSFIVEVTSQRRVQNSKHKVAFSLSLSLSRAGH